MAIVDINGNVLSTGSSGGSSAPSKSELQRKFSGKKIIWLGDSIHAYSSPDGVTIPYLFQYDSGAICYNWAQGGMTMAKMGVTNYDPYSGIGMVEALIAKDFTQQEAWAADNHGTAQGNFYEQVAEMKAIDMSTVHAVIIEYGTNDAWKQVPTDNENNVFDTTTTGGALRSMLKALQTAYPKLHIVVCNVPRMEGFSDAEHQKPFNSVNQNAVIESVCEEYAVPVIDFYNEFGPTEHTKATLAADGAHCTHAGKLRRVQITENRMVERF